MSIYVCKIQRNGNSNFILLPRLLSRGLGLKRGDKIMLEPQADGTILIMPSEMIPTMREVIKARRAFAEQQANGTDTGNTN